MELEGRPTSTEAIDSRNVVIDLTGERNIAATRDIVWLALNDPTILKNSIPGCEELEALPDGGFTGSTRMGAR
jgi:carbon monoxide dehydrogenase subunit G